MNSKKVGNALIAMASLFGEPMPKERLNGYRTILSKYKETEVLTAIRIGCETWKFFPKPAEIIEIVEERKNVPLYLRQAPEEEALEPGPVKELVGDVVDKLDKLADGVQDDDEFHLKTAGMGELIVELRKRIDKMKNPRIKQAYRRDLVQMADAQDLEGMRHQIMGLDMLGASL